MPNDQVQGAGDYEAARDHQDAVHEFAEAGEVQKAAHDADPPQHPSAAREPQPGGRQGRAPSESEMPLETSPTTIAQPPKGN